jgi:DNA polymerase
VEVAIPPTFEAWQAAARRLLREGVPPADVVWSESRGEAPTPPTAEAAPTPSIRVPRQFVDLAREVSRHPDPTRWQLLYEVLWRIVNERRDLLKVETDPQVRRLRAMAAGAGRAAYRAEMAEASRALREGASAALFVPEGASLDALRAAARGCTGCPLYRHATQTVFGQGPADARVVLVGEQPGDQEDRRGSPFVGPAGDVLDRALAEVGLARQALYVTNAVKHFKFVERGRRRIHQKPRLSEIVACRPWLEAELAAIHPEVLVCLGATAAASLLGAEFRLMRDRGRLFPTRWAPKTIATLHPSAVLRGEDEAMQARLYRMLVDDFRVIAAAA